MSAFSDPKGMPQRQIGELMTELGLITAEQLATVLEVQHRSKRPLGQIVVELGFASGAAVAHALAMQSGGALRTEYGFALGVSPELAEPKAGETGVGLPKLRLAPTAVPPIRVEPDPGEDPSVEGAAGEEIESAEPVEDVTVELDEEAVADESEPDVDESGVPEDDTVEAEDEGGTELDEESTEIDEESTETEDAEVVAVEPEDAEPVALERAESVEAPDGAELHELRAEVERLQATLVESVATAKAEAEGLAHLPAEVENLERTLAEARTAHDEEIVSLRETHEHAVAEVERLQAALSEEQNRYAEERRELTERSERLQEELEAALESLTAARSATEESDKLRAEIERLESALDEAQSSREEELSRLREEQQQASAELDGARAALDEANERHAAELSELSAQRGGLQHELGSALERLADLGAADDERARLRAELDQLQSTLAEEQEGRAADVAAVSAEREALRDELGSTLEQLAELGPAADERDRLRAELEQLQSTFAEEQERRAAEIAEVSAQRDALRDELGSTLEQLAELGPAADERDQLRSELEQLQSTFAEEQERRAAEIAEISAQREALRDELGSTLERLVELGPAADERDRLRAELEQLQSTFAEEQERRAAEIAEVSAQREALRDELGSTLEQLAELGPAADERDRLRAELEQARTVLAEVQESCAVEVRRVVEERDSLTTELEEARELLQQAERVRESQIALTAERDWAIAEAERLQAIASEAQTAAEQADRLLLEEQDGRQAERETAMTQRRVLEQELGDALERLAAANAAAGEREKELQLGSERLIEALNAVRELAADLVAGSDPPAQEAGPVEDPVPAEEPAPVEDAPEEAEAEAEAGSSEPETEREAGGYSLFVPGPNGYELIPQTGVAPQAGAIVELVLPDRDDVTVYEVARSSRTLPDGDICVYLSPR